ncbi:MAG TPA: hypothetical protein DEB40_13730 [Elusimicrobia bacterium]|nr:hypothetical protein [Elusimicrobiota bacterium]HBT62794.1 hypothetical protein [Elusimicrobiota bacterium]
MNIMKRNLDMLAAAAMLVLGMAALALAQSGGFHFFGPLSRVLTPNSDGVNDYAIFCFDNPSDSEVSGKVYSLLGSLVAELGPRSGVASPPPGGAGAVACPGGFAPQYSFWDGKADGRAVSSGVYLYRIEAEGLSFKGTLLVVR